MYRSWPRRDLRLRKSSTYDWTSRLSLPYNGSKLQFYSKGRLLKKNLSFQPPLPGSQPSCVQTMISGGFSGNPLNMRREMEIGGSVRVRNSLDDGFRRSELVTQEGLWLLWGILKTAFILPTCVTPESTSSFPCFRRTRRGQSAWVLGSQGEPQMPVPPRPAGCSPSRVSPVSGP